MQFHAKVFLTAKSNSWKCVFQSWNCHKGETSLVCQTAFHGRGNRDTDFLTNSYFNTPEGQEVTACVFVHLSLVVCQMCSLNWKISFFLPKDRKLQFGRSRNLSFIAEYTLKCNELQNLISNSGRLIEGAFFFFGGFEFQISKFKSFD